MNVYPVKVELNGKELLLELKLDVKHIRQMCADAQKGIMEIITDAPTDPGAMADLLDNALRFKNNMNPETIDGDDLYDLLAGSVAFGTLDWLKIVNQIASVSGILQPQHGAAMVKVMEKNMKENLEKIEKGEFTAEAAVAEKECPTQTAAEPEKEQTT